MSKTYGRCVVQHSGFGYAGNPEFKRGLETRTVTTKSALDRVTKTGGIVFTSLIEAEDWIENEQYPQDYSGLIPAAPGAFSPRLIDGLAIYIPATEPSS